YWSAKRHLTCGNPTPGPSWSQKPIPWRGSAPGKLKTATAALVLCLNIDVDPPDIIKTNPCANLECWVDPHTLPAQKALEAIGNNLQHQFEGLSLKIGYKYILDPSVEDLRRFCQTLRKQAKDDAVLFYYNGHGVPKPTASGELWCFNRNYTQYIPVSLQELQAWVGSPGVYIWDCSAAGHLLQNFNMFAERKDNEVNMMQGGYSNGAQPMINSLQLAACGANEQLPSCPELPADVFTSCLTSPIDIALRYFIMNHQLPNNITADMVLQLPGDLKDRRTPLGELNWIFTAITDTIAWTTFSRDIFTKLYRCDLLIASLFRNFLLAERIMKNYHCTPHTFPPLPPTNTHPLWATWDLAVDTCLRQLPDLLSRSACNPYVYVPSKFFADQLTAFEVWISRGGSALTRQNHLVPRKPPDQLPIVLQVLLSQPHRLRALILLSQFVDLGPWAVHLVLTIGIFPYISKLLQAQGQDLRPVLIFIWARILAVDPTVQTDLFNTQGFKYFANVLGLRNEDVLPNSSEHKAMCSFILAAVCRDFYQGQTACCDERVFDNCYERLDEADFLLRQWTALCIAQMWDTNDEMKVYGVDRGTQDKLTELLSDDSAEVRSAALYALGTFLGASGAIDATKQGGGGSGMEVAVATGATLAIKDDASPMCRKELLVLISCLVKEWRGYFVVCAWIYWEEDRKWRASTSGHHHSPLHDEDVTNQANRVLLSSFFTIFVVLLDLSVDPYQEVAANAQTIVDYIMALLLESPFTRLEGTSLNNPPTAPADRHASPQLGTASHSPPSPITGDRPGLTRSDTMTSTISSGVSNTLRRTSSFANALKSLANGIAFPSSSDDGRASPIVSTHVHFQPEVTDISRPPSPNLNVAQYTSPYSRPTTPQGGSHDMQSQNVIDFLPCDYFKEPQMRQSESDEPGSIQYNYQVWRQQRNERICEQTDSQACAAEKGRWDKTVATFQVQGYPLTMAFHSYDQHLVIANESDMISVWDWLAKKRLNYFCNGNPRGTSITSLDIINQDVGGLILTGSADGIVRMYRNYDPTLEQGPLQMVSAFRGLNEVVQLRQGTGMIMDWKQSAGILLVGGDSRVIKVWDAQTETQGLDLETNSDSPVTSITSDPGSSQTFIASFADGTLKVFDRRLEDDEAIVRSYSDHTSWVQNVRYHPKLSGRFLSASVDGQVKLWDLRGSDSPTQSWHIHQQGLSTFDVHPHSSVFAA
ncbi:uncharacterized protein LACBIDRAFT_242724, partial [Laccaria bicolor S238N-H82]